MRQREKRAFPYSVILVSLIAGYLLWQQHRHIVLLQADRMVSLLLYPCVRCAQWVTEPVIRWRQHRTTVDTLIAALQKAREQEADLIAELVAVRSTNLYGDDIAEINRFRERYITTYAVSGQLIARHCSSHEQVLLLDVGSYHGVQEDMVAVWKNCLVGRVTAVYPRFCRVVAITDKRSKIPVACTQTKTQAIYEGMNDPQKGSLRFVSHLDRLEQGEIVIASGDGFIYPKGFAVGRICDFILDSQGLHYAVNLEPLIDIASLRYVYVIQKGSEYVPDEKELDQNDPALNKLQEKN